MVVSRRYIPEWAIILAVLGALIFLLGLLFLLVKKEETLTVSVSPREQGGSTVVIGGEASDFLIGKVQPLLVPPTRTCSNCQRPVPRSASVCPHCGVTSPAWIFHAGAWWSKGRQSGEWQWVDEKALIWRYWKDGTPSDPAATDKTPNLAIDPAVVSPPAERAESAGREREGDSFGRDLEQLAALYERGALNEEEFRAAKARLLATDT